ncbi:MAG: bifunctional riboflavin kinase/FAD synthetase [Betaproteobacteria bacterium]|nr:bifunctional riboflavin kinase/FAD synthetase [Betaproteobacteria bacterium]
MRFFRGFNATAGLPCALTIGNFDGLHLGHKALLGLLADRASERGLPASALTFEPHPREFFSPLDAPLRLTSLCEKLLLFRESGVDHVHVSRFNADFSRLGAEEFIRSVLARGLNARYLLIGDDFRFGACRNGDFAMLQEAGIEHGFEVEAMPTLSAAGERASSSAVRKALGVGDLDHAALLLGRPYSIVGRVTSGNRLGRQIGFPTLNIALKKRRPAIAGVFAVEVEGIYDVRLKGVANVGVRPTVDNTLEPRLEVHLFDWSGECYGARLRVHFFYKLRDELRFPSLDALKAQIGLDALEARGWFSQQTSVEPS